MRYLSVCSGIEAATVAWHPLGWTPAAFSEIEAFPRAVLRHRWPDVPLHGDFTTIEGEEYGPVDLLVGGTPCQSFSVAGLRRGMEDARGNLALEFLLLARRSRARWVVWENVPGVMSTNDGRDFGSILGGLAELGYGVAYRVLDAQYVRVDGHPRAVPQRRHRVFVVGHLGDWRRAAAVLFERESMSGNPPPRRATRKGVAPAVTTGARGSGDFELGGALVADVASTLNAHYGDKQGLEDQHINQGAPLFVAQVIDGVTGTLTASLGKLGAPEVDANLYVAMDLRQATSRENGSAPRVHAPVLTREAALVAFAIGSHAGAADGEVTNRSHANGGPTGMGIAEELAYTVTAGRAQSVAKFGVRRLTPRECERLQGFPDDYTLVPTGKKKKPAKDGPRYKALGNSMAVNVMRWLGRRIAAVEAMR